MKTDKQEKIDADFEAEYGEEIARLQALINPETSLHYN